MAKDKKNSSEHSDSESDADASTGASDGENSMDLDMDKSLASSTHIESGKNKKNIKLQLVELIGDNPVVNLRHSKAVKKISWKDFKIRGYSEDELKEQLDEIIKSVGVIRTLGEIFEHYRKNQTKIDRQNHPDKPIKPMNAFSAYVRENREKLEKKMEKTHPGKKINYMELTKFASEKYSNFPEEKKKPYISKYKADMEIYKENMKAFLANHPELRTKSSSKSSSGQPKHAYLTPFLLYREEMLKSGEDVTYIGHQKLWKNMPDNKKLKYIKKVADKQTDEEKKISKQEWKILEGASGIPKRPMSAYNIFVKKYKESYKGDNKEFMSRASAAWSSANEEEKEIYAKKHEKLLETWKSDLEAYIRKLPKEQQPMMFEKYKDTLSSKTSSKAGSTPSKQKTKKAKKVKEESSGDSDDEPQPKKNKSSKPEKSSPKKRAALSSEEDEPPAKKKSNGETSQTAKKAKKIKAPSYPSQTTAHYFMTKAYSGDPKEVKKAYKNLNRQVKGKYSAEMKKIRQKFLEEASDYVQKSDPDEVEAFKRRMNELREQQTQEIKWHTSTGTDTEQRKKDDTSSDDSDSDSDSS